MVNNHYMELRKSLFPFLRFLKVMFGFLVIIQIVPKIPDILDQFLMDSFGDELAVRSDSIV